MDSAFSAIENQVQILQTKTTRLEENYYGGSDNKLSFDGSRRETFTDHDNAGRKKKTNWKGFHDVTA